MSWVKEASQQLQASEAEQRRQVEVLDRSNYWAALLRQVEADVQELNEDPYIRSKTGRDGITFGRPYNSDGWVISKTTCPGEYVVFENQNDYIEVARESGVMDVMKGGRKKKERLSVGVVASCVVLGTRNGETLAIPEQASRYLLQSIVDSLGSSEG